MTEAGAVGATRSGRVAAQLVAAIAFLSGKLAAGPLPAKEVRAKAKLAGISKRTLTRAKEELRVTSSRTGELGKRGGGTWFWALPEAESSSEHRSSGVQGPALPMAEPGAAVSAPVRRRLPDVRRSLTHKVTISDSSGGDHAVYLTVGLYPDGRPGELFIHIGKAGSTLGGLMDTIGIMVSFALQYGIPLEALSRKFKSQQFEPQGRTSNADISACTSIVDYKFKLVAIDQRGKEFPAAGPALTLGSNVHEALRRFFLTHPDQRSERKLLEILQGVFKINHDGFEDRDELSEYWSRAKDAMRLFVQKENILAQPVLVERNLYMDVDDFTVSGRIDRADRDPDGTYHIIDYKTGRSQPERLPLQIYAALAAHEFKVDELRVSYLYLEREANRWITEEATQAFIDDGLEEVRRRMALIRAETEFLPEPSPLCGWCQFLPICDTGKQFLDDRPAPLAADDLPIN